MHVEDLLPANLCFVINTTVRNLKDSACNTLKQYLIKTFQLKIIIGNNAEASRVNRKAL